MTVITFQSGVSVGYDNQLYPNIIDMKNSVDYDRDLLILICGPPGSGKSVLGQQLCALLDPDFSIDNIVFDHEKLIEKALKLKKGSAILWDESRQGLSNRNATTAINKRVLDFMAEVRQLNLKMVFIIPDFWDFEMPIATVRSSALIRVYQVPNPNYNRERGDDPFLRGNFGFYSFDTKKRVYILGKKFRTYNVAPDFTGSFSNIYTVPENQYRALKLEALRAKRGEEQKKEDSGVDKLKDPRRYWEKAFVLKSLKSYFPHITQQELAKIFGTSQRAVSDFLDAPSEPVVASPPKDLVDAYMEDS